MNILKMVPVKMEKTEFLHLLIENEFSIEASMAIWKHYIEMKSEFIFNMDLILLQWYEFISIKEAILYVLTRWFPNKEVKLESFEDINSESFKKNNDIHAVKVGADKPRVLIYFGTNSVKVRHHGQGAY